MKGYLKFQVAFSMPKRGLFGGGLHQLVEHAAVAEVFGHDFLPLEIGGKTVLQHTLDRIITDGIKNEVIYFGVQGKEKEVEKDNLIFKYLNYSSVGFFKTKDDDSFVDLKSYTLRECEDKTYFEILSKEKIFKFEIKNREKFDSISNRYNYVASFSLFMTLIRDGIVKCENPEEKILNAINLEVKNGRMEDFKFHGKSTKLNLIKNKVSLELSLMEYAKETEKFDLV